MFKISIIKNEVVLITGENSFLGKTIIKNLYKKFTILKTDTKKLNDLNYFQANLTIQDEAKKLIEWALQKEKKIDFLICCAGGNKIFPKTDDAYNINSKDITSLFEINVNTAINCCHYIVPHMIKRKSGSICFVGSDIVGKPQEGGFLTGYTIAKAALHEYTAHLSNQLKNTGVFVNCVSPCGISGSSNNEKITDINPNKVSNKIEFFLNSKLSGTVLRVTK